MQCVIQGVALLELRSLRQPLRPNLQCLDEWHLLQQPKGPPGITKQTFKPFLVEPKMLILPEAFVILSDPIPNTRTAAF